MACESIAYEHLFITMLRIQLLVIRRKLPKKFPLPLGSGFSAQCQIVEDQRCNDTTLQPEP